MHRMYLLALAACASSPTQASVHADGNIDGKPAAFQTAAAQVVNSDKGSMLLVYLSPTAEACGATSWIHPGDSSIVFALYKQGPGAFVAGTDAGVYTTNVSSPGPWVEVDVAERDATCSPGPADGKAQGTVTLTAANTGTFDLTLDTGDHLTGSFSAEACTWQDSSQCQ